MLRFNSIASRSASRRSVLFLTCLLLVGLVGCLAVPLGDPEKSKVDPQLSGLWMEKDGGNGNRTLVSVIPFDARSYVVTWYGYEEGANGPIAKNLLVWKMWLTDVKGATFVTMESKDAHGLIDKNDTPFVVAKLTRAGDTVTMQGVKPEFVKENNVTTSDALAKLIADHLDDAKLYLDNKNVYDKMPPDKSEEVKKILDAFGSAQ